MTIPDLLNECEELFLKKDFKRLKWVCQKILQQDRENEMALAYHAYVYWDRAGWFDEIEYEKVFKIAEKIHRLYPDNYHAYNVEAMAYLANGKFERALECCDEGLKIKEYYWLKINRVEALICLDRIEEAFEFYKSLDIPFYTFTKALINCAKLSRLCEYDKDLSGDELLDYLFEKRKYVWNRQEVKWYFEDLLMQDRNNEIALTYMEFYSLDSDEFEEVFDIAKRIHRSYPDNYHSYHIEATAYLHMAESERALECCDEGLKVKNHYLLKRGKIESLICLGRIDEAFGLYNASEIPGYNFTDALIRCEKYSQISSYDCGLCDDEVVESLLNKCRYLFNALIVENGEVSSFKMKYEKLLKVCDEIFKIDNDNEIALGYKIVILNYFERPDEILECCNHAIELYPKNFRFYYLKAEALYIWYNDLYGAIRNYEKSLALDFNGENAIFILSDLESIVSKLIGSGDYLGAIDCCEMILSYPEEKDEKLDALFHIDSIVNEHGVDYKPSKNYQEALKSNQKIFSLLMQDIGEYDKEYVKGCEEFKDYGDYEDYLRDVIICLSELCPDSDEKSIREMLKFNPVLFSQGFAFKNSAYDEAAEYMKIYHGLNK